LEAVDLEQAEVSRDAVAALQQHDIAGDELGGGDAEAAAVAPDGGLGDDHSIEGIDGFFRFDSWMKPMMALMNTTPKMTPESTHSWRESGDEAGGKEDVNEGLMELQEEAGDQIGGAVSQVALEGMCGSLRADHGFEVVSLLGGPGGFCLWLPHL
jgi:hypothetical protein